MVVHFNGDASHGIPSRKKITNKSKKTETEDVWLGGIEPTIFFALKTHVQKSYNLNWKN